jgi:lysophospholipase L1-like esterase
MTRIAEERSVPWIEVEDVLHEDAVRTGRRRADYFLSDKFHLDADGHAVLAQDLAERIARSGWISGRAGPVSK